MTQKKFITNWFFSNMTTKTVVGGVLGMQKKQVWEPKVPDVDDMAKKLESIYNDFDAAGYDVVNILPINIGSSEPSLTSNNNYLGDIGYSINRGAIVVGKLRE